VETVEPLATDLGLVVEESPELAEATPTADAVALLRHLGGAAVVACSHGDVIPQVLDVFSVEEGLELPVSYPYAKGSTWELETEGGRFVRARYLPPPA
jgi:hypothetical protein